MKAKLYTLLGVLLISLNFTSCATKKLAEHSKEELSSYVWTNTLVAVAIGSAMGPLDPSGVKEAAKGMSQKDVEALTELSAKNFHPAKVYAVAQKKSLDSLTRDEVLSLAKKLESPVWQEFGKNLLIFYGQEGSEEVAQVMREIDSEDYELDMEKAYILERISQNSYNFKIVDMLFSKVAKGSDSESFLYRKSLFVTTYLAGKDFGIKELKEIEAIRSDKVYQKYKKIFEETISSQYDKFFKGLYGPQA